MIEPYLMFNGQAADAIDFYEKVFRGTNKRVMRWSDAPSDTDYPVEAMKKEWVLHGEIVLCGTNFSISDCDQAFQSTHFVSLMARLDTPDEVRRVKLRPSFIGEFTCPQKCDTIVDIVRSVEYNVEEAKLTD